MSRPRLRPEQAATMRHHKPRFYDGERILTSWRLVAHYSGRSRSMVERHCDPVACDTASGLVLYDLDVALARLAPLAWRSKRQPRHARKPTAA